MVSKNSVRVRILPLTRDYRAFGSDRRVIQLNYVIDRDWDWDWPTPPLVSRVAHSIVHLLKETVRTVFISAKSLVRHLKCSRVDVEADTSEEKSVEEKAMDEYQRKLENTFGSSRRIDEVMFDVRGWTNGA